MQIPLSWLLARPRVGSTRACSGAYSCRRPRWDCSPVAVLARQVEDGAGVGDQGCGTPPGVPHRPSRRSSVGCDKPQTHRIVRVAGGEGVPLVSWGFASPGWSVVCWGFASDAVRVAHRILRLFACERSSGPAGPIEFVGCGKPQAHRIVRAARGKMVPWSFGASRRRGKWFRGLMGFRERCGSRCSPHPTVIRVRMEFRAGWPSRAGTTLSPRRHGTRSTATRLRCRRGRV
jgi:hypothetical protein